MLKTIEITSKNEWEKMFTDTAVTMYPFFQSWNWGEVQKGLGNIVWRIGLYENNILIGGCQIVDVAARRGHYLHLRHGPVLKAFTKEYFTVLFEYIKKLAKNNHASFIRLSPLLSKQENSSLPFLKNRYISSPLHNMDAEICWVLDITKSEDELLQQMRKSHRYLIRKGIANTELKIIQTKNSKDIQQFLPLYKQLSKRRHFVPHTGIIEEFETFANDNQEVLYLAKYNNQIIAGAMIAFVGNMAIYRHSASNDEFKQIPAMHVVLWEAIKEAKKRGKKQFNFWGIAPDDKPNHPWKGLTLFKTGFGGEKKEFIHAIDIPLSPLYLKTYGIESITKILKGY
jgi:peptidoglycan pentaglycine glycine transferase (the first glycine)